MQEQVMIKSMLQSAFGHMGQQRYQSCGLLLLRRVAFLLDGLLRDVVPKLAGQAVVAGSGRGLVERHVSPLLRGPEAAGEAVGAAGETVPAHWRDVLVGRGVVSARAGQLVLSRVAPPEHPSEVAHAAVLVLGAEVLAALADRESHWVLPRPRHPHLLLVLELYLARKRVRDLGSLAGGLIVARARVLVLDGVDEGSGDHHLLPALPEGEAVIFLGEVICWERVCVGWGGGGRLLGEVVLAAVAEACTSGGEGVFDLVELIAAAWQGKYTMVLRLRKRDCLGKEQSILAEDWLVGALQIWLQLDIVTDMLLFLSIIRTTYHTYLFFRGHANGWADSTRAGGLCILERVDLKGRRPERTMSEVGFLIFLFLPLMKNSQSISHLPPLLPIANSSPSSPASTLELALKQDRYYCKPHLHRIAYAPFSEKRQKQNSNQLMLQSCISNRRFQEIWEEDNENKIRSDLGPSEDGSRKAIDPLGYIGKEAPLKHYKEYKRLEKTLLKKEFNNSAANLPNPPRDIAAFESPSVSLLEKSEALKVLPLCFGLIKSRGEAAVLNLTNYNLGDRYIIALAAGLKKAKAIEKCLLGANRITDLGLSEVVRAISADVLVLDLSSNKITQVDKRLLEMIIESEYKLQEINLANNLLKITAADSIFRNVRYSKHVKRLNLSKNKLGLACLDSLAELIEKSTCLEQLYIGTNYLSGKAGERIFGLLAGNKVLKVFDFSLNQLGDSGQLGCARAIAGCFQANRTLEHVDISFNNFGKEATEIIAEGLEPNKHIYGIHYRGNYGWVNSRGFLMVEEKQETLLDCIDQQRMNGFEVTAIRENITLKSEPIKNVCWICEGWHEQEFRLSLTKTEGKLLVYIHFDFEKYEPRLISQNEHVVRYVTMVPPKKYRYFFTHNKEVLLDGSAQVEKLPIAEDHSYEVESIVEQFRVESVNFRTSKARKIVNEAGQITVKTLPRFNGLVTRKVKTPWSYAQSIWAKEWKLDDEELLKKCFQRDWKHSKIMNLIKNQTDQDKVKALLWSNYASIKTVYKQFASWNPFGDIWAVSNQPFTEFCQQAKIINKDTPLKITDLTFITTNSMSGPDWKGNPLNPERGLVRFQFMESLVRLAEEKFKKNGVFDNFAESVETLLRDHLQPLVPLYNANQWRLERYFTEHNDALLKKYRPVFASIYKRNSKLKVRPGEKPFMCLAEFKSILERSGLNPYFPERDSFVSFNCSMMTQVDELESERFMKMTEIEFIEAMARIANSLPKECCVEADEVAPLHMRFEWTIQQLKSLCPQDIKNQYPDISCSMFRALQQEDAQ